MTDSGKLLRNVSVATALCATTALLAVCGSAGATTTDAAVAAATTRSASASTGGAYTITEKPLDPKAWLIPRNVVSIRVIARPGWNSTASPAVKRPPVRQIATISDRKKVDLVAHQLNTLPFMAGPVACAMRPGGDDGAYLELDFYSAGHPKSPSATAELNNTNCNAVLLSAPGRQDVSHHSPVFNQVLKNLGLTLPSR